MENQQLTKQEKRELRRQERQNESRRQKTQQITRRVLLWSVVALLIGGAVFGMTRLAANPSSTQSALLLNAVSETDWVKGNTEAQIVLVEYSDFQCSACAAYYPLVQQLVQELGEQIQFVYRHFPLRQIHQNANLSAQAAEAAGKQGKFWEMHNMIFENQQEWSNKYNAETYFVAYAEKLNLDVNQFKSDIDSKTVKDKVENDYISAITSGLNGTPTFFLNGKQIQNPRSYDEFKKLINQAGDSGLNS